MKIKDIKGMADKLPKLKPQFLAVDRLETQRSICQGRCEMNEEVLSTDIDLQDIVEIDKQRLCELLKKSPIIQAGEGIGGIELEVEWLVRYITAKGCIRWKEEQNG